MRKKYLKIASIYSALFIITTFIIGLIMKASRISIIGGSTDAWLNYYSSILGTTLVVFGTYFISNRELTIEKEKERKANEPRLRCVTSEVELEIGESILYEQIKNINPNSVHYSNKSIKILNLGRNAITDIKYSFEILNFDKIIKYIEDNDLNQYTFSSIRKMKLFKSDKGYWLQVKGAQVWIEKDVKKERYLEYLLPNNEENIFLPLNLIYLQVYRTYFNMLWNIGSAVENLSKDLKIPEPVVRLHIEYTDHLGRVNNKTTLYKITTICYTKNDNWEEKNTKQIMSYMVFEPQLK
ncbi:hypothetical protein ACVRW4_06285 [Streptococcus phocae subsp. phocae]|uniref:Uncharacterized protein n=1 Tax=Streptococcus phocae TaxID=119224 RepID=A0A0P6SDG2_9STRE|nr:hypothetical protein [Streptococcus phocae]KPJ22117.1 hypothetical protein AKK44_06375 [Streptococcus phocae]